MEQLYNQPPSLVDIRSTEENILDHWHRLVDCRQAAPEPRWAEVRQVELPYGWVTFSNLAVVRSLGRERAREVGERAVQRAAELGALDRANRHAELEVQNRAEERCREVRDRGALYDTVVNIWRGREKFIIPLVMLLFYGMQGYSE